MERHFDSRNQGLRLGSPTTKHSSNWVMVVEAAKICANFVVTAHLLHLDIGRNLAGL